MPLQCSVNHTGIWLVCVISVPSGASASLPVSVSEMLRSIEIFIVDNMELVTYWYMAQPCSTVVQLVRMLD